jgi:FKBP-type peptidyl-prolyl cis-trans isomerase
MEGWDVALRDLRLRQKAEVVIAHPYAYGEAGYPPKIPPKATLLFRMEIVV